MNLLESGCVVEQSNRPVCVNPLSVSVNKNGKERLILDFRHVNQFVEKRKIKFEGSKETLNYAKKGKFMVKFDLRSGYHHVDINNKFQRYLGFSWEINGQVKYFVFSVLTFGLTSAPFLFTKLMRKIVRYWRTLTFPVIIHLDDGWCCHDRNNCQKISKSIRKDLVSASFIVNDEKSVWEPIQRLEWFGFMWDLRQGSIEIPETNILHLKNNLYSIIQFPDQVTAMKIASIISQIISMSYALGNVCHIMTRNLHWPILNRIGWDQKINFTPSALNELIFWLNNCDSLPFKSISTAYKSIERIVFSDVSNYTAAVFLLQEKNQAVHIMVNNQENNKVQLLEN